MRTPVFAYAKRNAQLSGTYAAQLLSLRFIDGTISLLPKSEFSRVCPSFVAVQSGLCGTWSEIPKTNYLMTRLVSNFSHTPIPIEYEE